MYAVVKAGGKQHKVAVGDVVEVNRLDGEAGDSISLPALLVVDGADVTTEGAALAKITVTGEIVGHHKGPKIKILKYKNKTGYRKRIGHRQHLTELLVIDIDDGKPKKKKAAAAAKAADKAETTSDTVKTDIDLDTAEKSSAKKTAATKTTPTAAAKTTTAKAASTSTSTSTSTKDTAAKSAKATSTEQAESTTADSKAAKASTAKPAKAAKPSASTTSKSTDEKED